MPRKPLIRYAYANYAAPVHGWNPDTPPHLLDPLQAPVLDNLIPEVNALVRMRGGFQALHDFSSFGGPIGFIGGLSVPVATAGGAYVIMGRGLRGSSGRCDPWNAVRAGSQSIIANAAPSFYYRSADGLDSGAVTVTADQMPGPRWVSFGSQIYGLSYDASTAPTTASIPGALALVARNNNLLTFSYGGVGAAPTTSTGVPGSAAFADGGGGSGFTAWATPNNAQTVNSVVTQCATASTGANTDSLNSSSLGFALPSTAIVQGIQVDIMRSATSSPGVKDLGVQLFKGGGLQPTNRAVSTAYPTSLTNQTYGGPTDLWGNTWLYSDINAAGFGVHFQAQNTLGTVQVNVDAIVVTVYYVTVSPTPPTAYPTTAPRGGYDLDVYLSRLWIAGGVDVPSGGTTHSPTKVFYTNPGSGGTLGTLAADWRDPLTGSSNSFELDQDYSDPLVGLATYRNVMLFFRKNSVWVMTGTTSTTFANKRIGTSGCIDMRSIVETDVGVFFMGPRGFMYTDGVNVKNVSGPVGTSLAAVTASLETDLEAGIAAWCTAAKTLSGDILITCGTENLVAGAQTSQSQFPTWSGLFTPTTGTWVRITSQLYASDNSQVNDAHLYPGKVFSTIPTNTIFSIGDSLVTQLDSPYSGMRNSYGVGKGAPSGTALTPNGLYDESVAGNALSIPAKWMTPNLNTIAGTGRHVAKANRIWIDYAWESTAALVPTTGWSLAIVDGSGTDQGFALNAPKGATRRSVDITSRAIPNVQRAYMRWLSEIQDFYIVTTWTDSVRTASSPMAAMYYDIYGIGVEFWPVGPEEPMP